VIVRTEFSSLLDDGGHLLNELKAFIDRCRRSSLLNPKRLWEAKQLWKHLHPTLGLYSGDRFARFLREKLVDKHPTLRDIRDITFGHLTDRGCKPVKVVASDVTRRKPVVYSSADLNDSVIHAVRASIGYPLIFEPVRWPNGGYMVDGGLSSNLPSFLFAQESKRTPVFAFDLISPCAQLVDRNYDAWRYLADLLATSIETGDTIHRSIIPDIHYVPILIPNQIGTFDMFLDESERLALMDRGAADAHTHLTVILQKWTRATTRMERYQALVNRPSHCVEKPLSAFAHEIETSTPANSVRASVLLPAPNGRLELVYRHGIAGRGDDTNDVTGDSIWGKTFARRDPRLVDLTEIRRRPSHPDAEILRFMPDDRRALICVPLFDLRNRKTPHSGLVDLDCIGVLSADTDTPLDDTCWLTTHRETVVRLSQIWADVIAQVVT
jgi:NTE family protein